MTCARKQSEPRHGVHANQTRGQAQLEFVLSILFLILTIFGVLELVLFVYTYNVLADAAKEGVRYAIVHGTDSANCSGPGGIGSPAPILRAPMCKRR